MKNVKQFQRHANPTIGLAAEVTGGGGELGKIGRASKGGAHEKNK